MATYNDMDGFLGRRSRRALRGRATELARNGEVIELRYHQTAVLTWHPDGRIVLNTGGWHTPTTKARLNDWLPLEWRVFQRYSEWWLQYKDCAPLRFEDGMVIWGSRSFLNWAESEAYRLRHSEGEVVSLAEELIAAYEARRSV